MRAGWKVVAGLVVVQPAGAGKTPRPIIRLLQIEVARIMKDGDGDYEPRDEDGRTIILDARIEKIDEAGDGSPASLGRQI